MTITYKLFDKQYLSAVLILQYEWFRENITFGIVPETPEEIFGYQNAMQNAMEEIFRNNIFGKAQIVALEIYTYPMELIKFFRLHD